MTIVYMKVLKVKSRNYNGKQYFKFRVNISEKLLEEAGFKEGDELAVKVNKGMIKLRKIDK